MSKTMDRMHALCDEHEQRCDVHPCKTTKHVYATIVLAEQVERIADALEALPPEKPRKDAP